MNLRALRLTSDNDETLVGRTAWVRNLEAPVRQFFATETGGAVVLVTCTVLSLLWANIDRSSYDSLWSTKLSVLIGGGGVSQDLRQWVNDGLMTFFFLVMALEARREIDIGELRERRRILLPLTAALGGMLVPVAIFLAINAGRPSAHGWGAAMSTDTAFALGMLALLGRRFPGSLRTFILTVAVADDLVAFVVIATVYTQHVRAVALVIGIVALLGSLTFRLRSVRNGFVYAGAALVAWVAFLKAGVDPVIVGVFAGLISFAYPPERAELERTTDLFRLFREQPTTDYARSLREGIRTALSPNARLQQIYHPLSSYLIVPLFALANAGITINGHFLAHAYTSAITLGVIVGYVVGKPIGISGGIWLTTKLSSGRIKPPVGWGSVLGGASIAGIGFTVSILIATLAFTGSSLEEAKLGVLTAGLCATALSFVVLGVVTRLPPRTRLRAVFGTSEALVDLAAPVDVERDHIRGPADAPVTLVEYGDFQCPYCGRAEPIIRELLTDFGDLRYVWRHLPLSDVHPEAQMAAEASEAATAQGKFWEMHDLLIPPGTPLDPPDLLEHARTLDLNADRFAEDLGKRTFAQRVEDDVASADASGVSGTPTFFINGRRHHGAYDIEILSQEVKGARARALLAGTPASADTADEPGATAATR